MTINDAANATLIASVFAFLLGIALVAIAVKMQGSDVVAINKSKNQLLEERIERLQMDYEKKCSDLQAEIDKMQTVISAMQGWLVDKQKMIDALTAQVRALENPHSPSAIEEERIILAAISQDSKEFMADRNMLLKVQSETGLQLQRVLPVTKQKLADYLSRKRMDGNPIKYVHFSLHSGPDGLLFADGVADGSWLASTLNGAEIVVMAGCENDRIADLIGVVPFVVSMREDVPHKDASDFTLAFWTEIGRGATAKAAYQIARKKVPAVAEYVDFHT